MWFWTLSLQNVLATVQMEKKPENVSGISEALLPLSLSLPKRSPCPRLICLLKSSPCPPHCSQTPRTDSLQFPRLPEGSWGLSICLFTLPGPWGWAELHPQLHFSQARDWRCGHNHTECSRFPKPAQTAEKQVSYQLRILLHVLKFPSKPLFLPGLWRHISSHYPWKRQDIAQCVHMRQKSEAALQRTWYLTPWIHSMFKSLHAGASGGILITLFFVEVFSFLPF